MQADTILQRHVLEELQWDPGLDAAQVGVIVKEGIVTLKGQLPVYAQKHTAEVVAKRVRGVRAVANEIEVRPTDAHVRDDEELAAAAVHGLMWSACIPDAQIQVAVEDGWITLEGTVQQQYQRNEAERVVRHLSGVRGITNSIDVAAREAASTNHSDIEAALRRSAALHMRELSAEVDGSLVILSGDVHSPAERDEAERIAWSAPGVNQLENCITVTPWGTGPAEEWGY